MMKSTSPDVTNGRPSKKGAAIGLTAGLVGGSLVGLVLGVPGLSSAADDGASGTPAAVVAQVDQPGADPGADPAADDAAEPGARLRELLQDLVDDGTIDAVQADAVTAHLIENRPERGDRDGRGRQGGAHDRFGGGRFGGGEALAEALGIDAETLRTELRDGQTIAELADANGVDLDTVVAALVAQAQERVDAAVEAGRITAEQGAERLAEMEAKITEHLDDD